MLGNRSARPIVDIARVYCLPMKTQVRIQLQARIQLTVHAPASPSHNTKCLYVVGETIWLWTGDSAVSCAVAEGRRAIGRRRGELGRRRSSWPRAGKPANGERALRLAGETGDDRKALPDAEIGDAARLGAASGERAGDRVRTGDIQLGRLTLYQLSYTRLAVLHRSTDGGGGARGRWDRSGREDEGASGEEKGGEEEEKNWIPAFCARGMTRSLRSRGGGEPPRPRGGLVRSSQSVREGATR